MRGRLALFRRAHPEGEDLNTPGGQAEVYENAAGKVADFCLGFFGSLAGLLVLGGAMILLSAVLGDRLPWLSLALLFALAAAWRGVIRPIRKKRRYFAMGVTAAGIVPLLIFGSCTLFLLGAFR